MIEKINIAVAGYGVFGSQLIAWLVKNHPEISTICVIEPNRHKRDLLKKLKLNPFESIFDVPKDLIQQIEVVVDCSTRGQGVINKGYYEGFGLRAIFQNGEEDHRVGGLFFPGLNHWEENPMYLKIPLCSGLAAIKVVKTLSELTKVNYISGIHCKVTNTARMLTMNYQDSNDQLKALLGVKSNMNVIYLRGEPYNGIFAYHGWIEVETEKKLYVSDIIDVVSGSSENLKLESQDIDNIFYPRTTDTIIIKDSINVKGKIVRLSTMSFTPDVNFPINLAAIKYLSRV